MKFKLNYVVIPLITIFVSLFGSYLTSSGMKWYDTINLPSFTPQGGFIGLVWTIIFILTTISALIFYNKIKKKKLVVSLFLINAFLNVFWSYLFFYKHLIFFALIEMIFLEISVLLLIIFMWKKSRTSSYLLFLYAFWVLFATYLTIRICY